MKFWCSMEMGWSCSKEFAVSSILDGRSTGWEVKIYVGSLMSKFIGPSLIASNCFLWVLVPCGRP